MAAKPGGARISPDGSGGWGSLTYLAAETVYQDVKSQGNVYRKSAAIRKAAKALRDALEPGGMPEPVF